ncbi:vacuolar fusion protein MON1 [Rhodotorula toruloides]|uniref:Vacuolar fusion protein MON1 n=1 Tax=Rhodotorula toruloides TaxID=5286 RepID=A0A511KM86_RHOTO|nr:vacuolar fusion protein MON1 [Rhodotorula toruloides]
MFGLRRSTGARTPVPAVSLPPVPMDAGSPQLPPFPPFPALSPPSRLVFPSRVKRPAVDHGDTSPASSHSSIDSATSTEETVSTRPSTPASAFAAKDARLSHPGAAEDGELIRQLALLDVDETDEESVTEEDARGRPARHFLSTRLSPTTSPTSPPYLSSSDAEEAIVSCGCGDAPTSPLSPASPLSEDDDFFSEGEQIPLADEPAGLGLGFSKRPSLALPSLPGGGASPSSARQPLGRQRSVSGSAFVEEGITRMDEARAREAGEGGLLGLSESEGEAGTATATPTMSFQTTTTTTVRPSARQDPVAGPSISPTPLEPLTSADERSKMIARRLLRKKRRARKKEKFERFVLPTEESMQAASECELVGEGGQKVTFGELIKQRGQKVIVIFLRHAWCGLCAQYVEALNRTSLSLVSLSATTFSTMFRSPSNPAPVIPPLHVLLINSGSPSLISAYRNRMETPFPLYTDRKRSLYKALGMTRKTWDMGKEAEKGSYIVKSNMENVTSSIKAGVAMPRYPGSQTQLGGEFVFEYNDTDDKVDCLFAARMSTTRNHAGLRDVFSAAGVELNDEDAASVYTP